jgi:hypothetical protein
VRSRPSKTRSRDEEYPSPSQGRTGVRHRHLLGSCQARLRSPLWRGPIAAAWPMARDVSRRVDSNVRPLGHVIFAFIAEIARRLSALQTGGVPTQHLMCPVQSDGRRRASPISQRAVCSHRCTRAATIMTCTIPRNLLLHAKPTQVADVEAQGDNISDRH